MEVKEDSRRRVIVGVGAAAVIFVMLLPLLQESSSRGISYPTFNLGNQHLWGNGNISPAYQGSEKMISEEERIENMKLHLRRLVRGETLTQLEESGVICMYEFHFEQCLISKPIMIRSSKPYIIYVPSDDENKAPENFTIRPYARREDQTAMNNVTPVQILHGMMNLSDITCDVKHDFPAVVFSSKGFTANIFHEFNEIIIPLFITTTHFGREMEFVVTDYRFWWLYKYKEVLKKLSPFEAVNPDIDDGRVHCFPGAVIGLTYHDNIALNSSQIPGNSTMSDFRHFIGEAYNLTIDGPLRPKPRPKLLLLSRQQTRVILNEDQLVQMMEKELGFKVHRTWANETMYLHQFAPVVNSYDVVLGAHGAGLMNEIFLRNGSVVVQIVPLSLGWGAETYYGNPAVNMGLNYFEYKIEPKESSLYDVYGPDDPIISDEMFGYRLDYRTARSIYIDGQNVTINLGRFRRFLVEALKPLGFPNP